MVTLVMYEVLVAETLKYRWPPANLISNSILQYRLTANLYTFCTCFLLFAYYVQSDANILLLFSILITVSENFEKVLKLILVKKTDNMGVVVIDATCDYP